MYTTKKPEEDGFYLCKFRTDKSEVYPEGWTACRVSLGPDKNIKYAVTIIGDDDIYKIEEFDIFHGPIELPKE